MDSQFEGSARFQTILLLWVLATPIFGLLLYAIIYGANHTTAYFWPGLIAMINGYVMLCGAKWDQIQSGELFICRLARSPRGSAPLYVAAYVFMIGGLALAGFLGIN